VQEYDRYSKLPAGPPYDEIELQDGLELWPSPSKARGGAKRRCLCCFQRRWACVVTALAVVLAIMAATLVALRYAFLPGFIAREIRKVRVAPHPPLGRCAVGVRRRPKNGGTWHDPAASPSLLAPGLMQRSLVFHGVRLTNPTANTLDMFGSATMHPPLPINLDM
jgi:hypothetical protein